jgi:uncharacterized protein YcfJ
MTKYLAGVLTVIAVGVLLVAYGLLSPRAEASFVPDPAQAQYGMQPALTNYNAAPARAYAPQYAAPQYSAPQYAPMQVQTPRPVMAQPVRQTIDDDDPPVRRRTTVERAPSRDWKKTAMIIGGSSATGAGVGAIFGGKKGALIGAAIGGGASTIWQTTK